MLNRPSKAVVILVVGIVGALVALSAFLMLSSALPDSALAHPHDPQQTHLGVVGTDVEHIHYDENGMGPVHTFMSTDPETGNAVDWDITGTDADDFWISETGELTFKMSPDFEKPVDGLDADNDGDFTDDGDVKPDNAYEITVRATEQETPGDPMGRALSAETRVIIVVNNMDEDGMVELNYLEPEVGTKITAMLTDEDVVVDTIEIEWMWSVSKVTNPDKDTEAHWASATGTVNTDTYIPIGVRDPAITSLPTPNSATPVDEGEMLRAKASYTDGQGEMKTAIGVSMHPVRAEVNSDNDLVENADNGSPGFPDGLDYTRSVPETTDMGMDVGPAVEAQDPNSDTLSYMLVAVGPPNGMDVGFFDVNRATGQLTVEKMLDHEAEDGRPYDATPPATAGEYKVIVRATDPSGESDDTTVTITVTDSNDDPVIRGKEELSVMEQDSDDGDDADSLPDKPYTGGPEMLVTQANTNANVYRASDDDERGTISWGGVNRSGFKEDDNDPEAEDWRLFVLSSTGLTEEGEPRAIRFIDPPDYESPADANRDNVYKVTLVATDGVRGGKDEFRVSILVRNENEQGELTLMASGDDPTQPVVGQPITAMVGDPDGGIAIVTWQWSRSDTKDGTYMPIPSATWATYKPVPDADEGMFLRATATYLDTTSDMDDPDTVAFDERVQESDTDAHTATTGDGSAAGVHQVYRVMATTGKAVRVGEDDTKDPKPESESSAPVFSPVSYTGTVYENSEVGSLVMMSDMVSAGEDQELMLDPLDGDNKYFAIDQHGQIRVGKMDFPAPLPTGVEDVPSGATAPDMEDPVLDYETRSTYRLVVSAESEGGRSTANVVLSLMDRNEHPYFDKVSRDLSDNAIDYTENSRNRTVTRLAATEPDEDSLRWEVVGTDSADFEIVQAPDGDDRKDRVELRFKTGVRPDFERPMDRLLDLNFDDDGADGADEDPAGDNKYRITVRVTEAATVGMVPPRATELHLTIMVQDAEETGEVQLNWRQPEVGTPITASLTDPDAVTDAEADGRVTRDVAYRWFRAKVRGRFIDDNIKTVPDEGNKQWEPLGVDDDSGFNTHTYTPQGAIPDDPNTPSDESDVAANDPVDEGWHLLARATYTSDTPVGGPVTAIGISEFPVRADVHDNSNNSPDFSAAKITREVPEDIDVDDPVGEVVDVDTNEDSGDYLTYELVRSDDINGNNGGADDGNTDVDTNDLAFFYIDRDTGQIRVKKPLDFEAHVALGALGPAEYTVVVRATDPSGEGMDTNSDGDDEEENRDDITVVITVTDVNEAPKVTDGYSIIQVKEMNESKEPKDGAAYYIGLGNEDVNNDGVVDEGPNKQNYYKKDDEDPVDSHDWPDNLIPGPDGRLFEYSTPTDGISRRLHFITPPDYEEPKDQNGDNVYEVCVTAIDNGDLSGCKMVRIEVLNVQEDGMLTLMPTEPEEGNEVEAMLTDPDGEVVITDWKWAQNIASGGMFGEASLVDGATMYKYRGEVGNFVWAQVHYRDGASEVNHPVTALDERNDDPATDNITEQHKFPDRNDDDTLHHNSDQMLSEVTDSAVQGERGGPTEPDTDDITTDPSGPPSVIDIQRMVPENTPSTGYVGRPLEKTVFADEDGLVHTMTGADANVFVFAEHVDTPDGEEGYYDEALTPTPDAMDDKRGQLALAPVNDLDFEASKNAYIIEFSDNAADSDVYRVTILVTDVNEAPSMPEEARGGINITGPSNISRYYEGRMDVVADYGTTGGDSMATVTWALSGDDMDDLSINSDGELTFDLVPDFENPMDSAMNNIYSITVEAEQGTNYDSVFVTVTVGNMEEPGMVTVDPMGRPAVDREITAMLEDPDGVMGTVMWQWASADAMGGTYTDIDMATMHTYTPMGGAEDDDVGMYLQVTAEYEDGEGRGKMAMLELMGAVTDELSFDADVIERMVAEDAMAGDNVGEPVMAAGGLASQLTYSLDGADASSFTIDVMGQIMVGTGTDLDYETKVTYTVMVTARGIADDGTAEVAMTTVTVTVTNVDEDETLGPEPDGGILAMYDANDNSLIERSEAVDAVLDFLILNEITRDQAIEVVTAFILQTAVP